MKRQLLSELIELTKQQTKALEREDIDSFNEILQERQIRINQLEKLHKDQPELRLQREADLVEELQRIDNLNRLEFERQFNDVKAKLKEIREMKKRQDVYEFGYTLADEEGLFFDKRNE